MADITFYILNEKDKDKAWLIEQKVLSLCQEYAKQGATLFINCQTIEQAELIDELLFQLPAEDFISHHLSTESPFHGNAVEIGLFNSYPRGRRNIFINLAENAPNFAPSFRQVIDFVPCDDTGKQQARTRYQIYRQAGHQLHTFALDTPFHT